MMDNPGPSSTVSPIGSPSASPIAKEIVFGSPSSMRKITGVTISTVGRHAEVTLLISPPGKLETFTIERNVLATLIANGAVALT